MRRWEFEVVFVCACVSVCMCISKWIGGKQPLVVCLSQSWLLVCLVTCVWISDFPCVLVSVYVRLSGCSVELKEDLWSCNLCQPQTPPLIPQSYLMISLTPPLSSLACVAATVWCYSFYMPFAASYSVKFNCTDQCRGIFCSLPSLTHTQKHCLSTAFNSHFHKNKQGIPLSSFSCIFISPLF